MEIETRDFGKVNVEKEDIIHFTKSIYGFNHLHQYTLLHDEDIGDEIVWLQSVEDKNVCFILIDVAALGLDYHPALNEEANSLLSLNEEEPSYFAIATIKEDFKESTMNLKSPILINMHQKLAIQEILEEDYPLRFPLFEGEE